MVNNLIAWLLIITQIVNCQNPIVQTNYGPVKGFSLNSTGGKNANIFLGIPFAKPPVGELRFEKPQKPDKWTTPIEALKFKSGCYPHDRTATGNMKLHSEDCLHLNIMSPAEKSTDGYAVLFWIHGGAFEAGTSREYKYQHIINNFVARDVVFVTFQYRLGFLGFLSSGDEVMPGNLGLWDQIAALQFVKENIAFFGGDPNRIILMGLSAGAASASALTLSPHSQNLFAGTIQMSGSAFAEWSCSELVDDVSLEIAAELQCPTSNSTAMKQCLKNKNVEQFFDAVNKTGRTRDTYKVIKYGPRMDNDFFPKDIQTLTAEAPKKPTIIGVTEKEGIYFTLFKAGAPFSHLYVLQEDFKNFSRDSLITIIRNKLAMQEDLKDDTAEVQQKIIDFYAKESDAAENDYKHWLQKYTQIITDVSVAVPPMMEAQLKIQYDWPVWLYITDYYNPALFDQDFPDKGPPHTYEEAYMFGLFYLKKFPFDANDEKLQAAILDSFCNFAKTGNPSTQTYNWETATKQHLMNNLRFRPDPIMQKKSVFDSSIKFWRSLETYSYNIITGKTNAGPATSRTISENVKFFCVQLALLLYLSFH